MSATPAPETAAEEIRAAISVRAFLTMRPVECVAGTTLDAKRGVLLAARDTAGLFATSFSAQWLGADAVRFLADHQQELKPGRCLDLEIYNVRPVNSEIRASVKSCQLAPLAPSWIAHEEKLRQQSPPTQPTQEQHPA